ncbi:MAG: ATP-binding protein [Rhodospirillales bacterium]
MSSELLTSLAPAAAIAVLVLAVAAAVTWPMLILTKRKLADSEADRARLARQAELAREVLASAPDALYLFNRVTGAASASSDLAKLFGIGATEQATLDALLDRLPVEAARAMRTSVDNLQQSGQAFDISVTRRDDQSPLRVIGARAHARDGAVLADLLWFRDLKSDAPPPLDKHLPAVLDALPVPIWLRDARLRIVFANKACGEGAPASDAALNLAASALSDGMAHSESHVLSLDGRKGPARVTETPIEGWQGTGGVAVPLAPDAAPAPTPVAAAVPAPAPVPVPAPLKAAETVTAARVASDGWGEQAIAEAAALEPLASGLALFQPDRRLGFANQAFSELWGLDRDWLNRMPMLEDLLDRLRADRRLPEVADFRRFREEHRNRFGRLDRAVTEVLHLPDGRTLRQIITPTAQGGLVYAFEDLSERLALEREFTELYRVQIETLDNLFEAIAVFGSDGRMRLCNPPFLTLWGLEEEQVEQGFHVTDFVAASKPYWQVSERDWPEVRDTLAAQILAREPVNERMSRRDGIVLDAAIVPLPDGASLVSHLDVTDSAEVERALRERADAIDEAGRLRAEFIANVSFEVRTPLNAVRGYAEALDREYFGPLNSRQKDYAGGIVKAADQLNGVLADILDLAAIEAGTMALDPETVDLHGLLVSVLGLVRERARAKQLSLEFDCPANIGWIVADPKRLRQVLLNLLGNAIDFSPERRKVRLSAERGPASMVIRVIDTGFGIPKADQERLLEPFERGNGEGGTARSDGAGLGLALVKRFVDLHGGEVAVSSAPNRGTTVTLTLPFLETEDA